MPTKRLRRPLTGLKLNDVLLQSTFWMVLQSNVAAFVREDMKLFSCAAFGSRYVIIKTNIPVPLRPSDTR